MHVLERNTLMGLLWDFVMACILLMASYSAMARECVCACVRVCLCVWVHDVRVRVCAIADRGALETIRLIPCLNYSLPVMKPNNPAFMWVENYGEKSVRHNCWFGFLPEPKYSIASRRLMANCFHAKWFKTQGANFPVKSFEWWTYPGAVASLLPMLPGLITCIYRSEIKMICCCHFR